MKGEGEGREINAFLAAERKKLSGLKGGSSERSAIAKD